MRDGAFNELFANLEILRSPDISNITHTGGAQIHGIVTLIYRNRYGARSAPPLYFAQDNAKKDSDIGSG